MALAQNLGAAPQVNVAVQGQTGAQPEGAFLNFASGITSKPAIEDHFKTGQRTITLDELVLPYRLAVWQVQFDPVRSLIVSPEMPAVIPARRSAGPYSSPPLPASGGEL